ncbi:MAG: hypothetical protein AAF589_01980 [Planctomycetota bacterium]
MDRLLRFTALAISGATLVWLSGCGSNSDKPPSAASGIASEIQQRRAEQEAADQAAAEAAAAAEQERLASEAPSNVTKDDYRRGSVMKEGSRYTAALGGALAAGEDVQLKSIMHQVEIQAQIDGYPKSHEEFMKLLKGWGMTLPPLNPPYEYWYDAETRTLMKRTTASAEAEQNAAEQKTTE